MRLPNSIRLPLVSRGFTLIELIVAVAILAILVAIAVPSFQEISLRNRSTTVLNDLLADLAIARSEAVKRAGQVSVVAKSDGWNSGWTVRVLDEEGDPEILRDQSPINTGGEANQFQLRAVRHVSEGSTSIDGLEFGAMGQIVQPDVGARFSLCRPDNDAAKSSGIRIDMSGRAQSVRDLGGLGLSC